MGGPRSFDQPSFLMRGVKLEPHYHTIVYNRCAIMPKQCTYYPRHIIIIGHYVCSLTSNKPQLFRYAQTIKFNDFDKSLVPLTGFTPVRYFNFKYLYPRYSVYNFATVTYKIEIYPCLSRVPTVFPICHHVLWI